MVDIQSAAAEISREKKKKIEDRKKPQDKNIMACPITYGGHNKCVSRLAKTQILYHTGLSNVAAPDCPTEPQHSTQFPIHTEPRREPPPASYSYI